MYESLHERSQKTVCVKQHKQLKRFLSVWGNNFVSERFLPLHEKSGIAEKEGISDSETMMTNEKDILSPSFHLHNVNEINVTRNDSYRRFR